MTLPLSALSDDEMRTIKQLEMRHDAELPELEAYDRYYEGTQPFTYMQPEILARVGDRIRPVIVFWPQLIVGSRDERLDVEGFRLPDESDADDELWRIWQANDLDEGSSMAHVDALVMRRSYICIGSNEEDRDTPLITVESPLEIYADIDPRRRRVRSALRRVMEVDPAGGVGQRFATLYLPNETIWCEEVGGGWKPIARDRHNVGEVLVEPLVNRQRLRSASVTPTNLTVERLGRSELDAVIPLVNAVDKLATDMMVAAEFVAIPLRALFGVGADSFKDKDGNSQAILDAVMGKMLTIPDENVKAFEFAAAQLQNFGAGIKELSQMLSAVGAVPPDYLGHSTHNPASAEAGRVAETRLIKRCERIQRGFGGSWERAMRKAMRVATGSWDDDLKRLETIWRDPSTPTVAAAADAAVKKFTANIVPKRQTREDLGYTSAQIERMEEEDEKDAEKSPSGRLLDIARAGADRPVTDAGIGNPAA